MNKIEIRHSIKKQRNRLSSTQIEKANKIATTKVLQHPLFCTSTNIALYMPVNKEVCLLDIVYEANKQGKKCFIPVINGNSLIFKMLLANTKLIKNKYGINEPIDTVAIATQSLDLVIVPTIAIDKNNNRLGSGGGFYDRTFAFKRRQPELKPHLLGISYDFQLIDSIPTKDHDIKCDETIVVTTKQT